MRRCCLIVQKVSYDHIKNVVHFIHDRLQTTLDPNAGLHICDEIGEAQHPENTIVFVVGENFARHNRVAGCTYVYLNFSIVAVMGNPLKMSRRGWSAIRRKQRMLAEKLDLYDAVLDYFPPQTRRLSRRLKIPVYGFSIGVVPRPPDTVVPLDDRTYDVCFVGGITPRRQRVLDQLTGYGLKISPTSGVVFEEIAAQSRCCINMHAHPSNHLETPRIIGALAAGTPVVTERSFGLNTLIPKDLCVISPINGLAAETMRLLEDIERRDSICKQSTDWLKESYLPDSCEKWAALCLDITDGINDNERVFSNRAKPAAI